PFAADGGEGDAERGGRFGDAHAGEVAQLDESRLARIDRREPRQRLVEGEHVHVVGRGDGVRRITEGDLRAGAAPLERSASASVIDEYAPHHLRGDGEELGPALPARVVLAVEPQPGLV